MTNLVFINENKAVTDSLTVAEVFKKEHKHVVRDIENQIHKLHEADEWDFVKSNFGLETFKAPNNKEAKKYALTEEAFTIVAMSYVTPEAMKMKVRFIEEFKRMREFIQQQSQPQDPVELALQTALNTHKQLKSIQTDVEFLKDSMRINGKQEHALKEQGKAKVFEVLGGYDSPAYKKLGRKVFSKLWSDFKRHFVLPRSMELAKKDFDEAVRFIAIWRPDTSMMMEIDTCNRQAQLKLVQ